MINAKTPVNSFAFGYIGWKYYNSIKKKAVEQEFSWSGLIISLSIAFFIVLACAQGLSLVYQSVEKTQKHNWFLNQRIYRLESKNYLNLQAKNNFLNILKPKTAYAAGLAYQGEIEKWTDYVTMEATDEASYEVKIKNTGSATWEKDKVFLETGPFLRSISMVRHSSWIKYYRPAGIEKDIRPGETATITFKLFAPKGINGDLQENFQLIANGQPVLGTTLRLFIEISSETIVNDMETIGQASQPTQETTTTPANTAVAANNETTSEPDFCIALTQEEREDHEECQTDPNENDSSDGISQSVEMLKSEPIIRIGIVNSTYAQRVTCNKYFDIYAGDKLLLSSLRPGYMATVSFDFNNKNYIVSTPGITKISKNYLRFVPREKDGIMKLVDFENRPKWNPGYNDNQFRNIIEFHYSEETDRFWIINELPISDYLKGLAETSNYSPVEYQKVIATAARTYAMYHYNRGLEYGITDGSTKHGYEHFHLDAAYDQVYRGYGSEIRLTRLSQAVDETRGMVITYENNVVVTPYFSRSDGRSRAWEEVWYGQPKPWLISVPVPEDEGQSLWGHGVGMSARAALIKVRDKKESWQEVLKYFYKGTSLQQIFK